MTKEQDEQKEAEYQIGPDILAPTIYGLDFVQLPDGSYVMFLSRDLGDGPVLQEWKTDANGEWSLISTSSTIGDAVRSIYSIVQPRLISSGNNRVRLIVHARSVEDGFWYYYELARRRPPSPVWSRPEMINGYDTRAGSAQGKCALWKDSSGTYTCILPTEAPGVPSPHLSLNLFWFDDSPQRQSWFDFGWVKQPPNDTSRGSVCCQEDLGNQLFHLFNYERRGAEIGMGHYYGRRRSAVWTPSDFFIRGLLEPEMLTNHVGDSYPTELVSPRAAGGVVHVHIRSFVPSEWSESLVTERTIVGGSLLKNKTGNLQYVGYDNSANIYHFWRDQDTGFWHEGWTYQP